MKRLFVWVALAAVALFAVATSASTNPHVSARPGVAKAATRNGDILYVGVSKNHRALYVMRSDGTHKRVLTAAHNPWFPAWSPAGKWIVYGAPRRPLCSQLYVIRADGTHARRLTRDAACYRDPAWSPDGQRIAFAQEGALGKDSIWTMKLDGSGRRMLTDDGDNPAWSPDGGTIAFERGVIARALWLMDASGANQRQLTAPVQRLSHSEQDFQPDWSPNGARIAFVRMHDDYRTKTYVSDVFTIRRDGSDLRVLTRPHARGSAPAWSPDGTRIVFLGGDPSRPGTTGLYVMKADGTGQKRLTRGDSDWPDWRARTLGLSASARETLGAIAKPIKLQTLVTTRGDIYAFAQDGAAIGWIGADAKIRVRLLTRGKTWRVGTVLDQDRAGGATLALAGTRALWAWDNGGNDYGTALMVGSPGRRAAGAGGLEGGYRAFGAGERFTGVAGDGDRLAYGWVDQECVGAPYGLCEACPSCPLSVIGGGVSPGALPATKPRRVIANIPPPAFFALAGNLVAAVPARSPSPQGYEVPQAPENGVITTYDPTGTPITSFAPHGTVRALALCRSELAVLMKRANGGNAIERYDPRTGRRIAMTEVLSTTAPALGVSSSGVVYRVGWKIYLFARHAAPRLVWQAKAKPIGLSIEGRRAAWAENVHGKGRIEAVMLR